MPDGAAGHGLSGLRERAARLGGAVTVGRAAGDTGFLLRVSVPASTIRLLLADDQALVRGALAALLSLEPDLTVVAEVGRGDEVVAAARAAGPGRGAAGRRDARAGRHRGDRGAAGRRARLPGADGHHVRPARLPAAGDGGRRERLRGQGHAGAAARRGGPPGARRPAGGRPVAGGRDARVRGEPADRAGDRRAAGGARPAGRSPTSPRALHLSEGTVRNHLSAAIGKTGARTRAEAVRIAEENGWL